MPKKKVLIFESLKWAWKTSTIQKLSQNLGDVLVLLEDETLEPIRDISDKQAIIDHYLKLLSEIETSEHQIAILDRFHFTKWPVEPFDADSYLEIETLLLEKFDPHLIFLRVDGEKVFERLKHTLAQRAIHWWKLNYDGASVAEEAERDRVWQALFIERIIRTTKIPTHIIDATWLHVWSFEDNICSLASELTRVIWGEMNTNNIPHA